jgi:hypothetical protein
MTDDVLGVQPIDPGYRTWMVDPHLGSLSWAEGQVPTPYGPIDIRVTHDGGQFSVRVTAPAHSSGTIALPVSATSHVSVNSTAVWANGRPLSGSGVSAHSGQAGTINLTIPAGGPYLVSATS